MDQFDKNLRKNQRKHTRFVRNDIKSSIVPISILGKKSSISCKLIDISAAGAQISSKEKFGINTKLTLSLQFDDEEQFMLKAKILRKKEINHYLTNHFFTIYKGFLNNKDNPLKSVYLLENGQKIEAKYRLLSLNCLRVLTFSPLKKKYTLAFTLKDGKDTKTDSQFKQFQHHKFYEYGVKFDNINDALADHLLETQTDLIFK
ncbi:MAG: hypothetical protein GQ475_08245 [Methylococcaceae bacterium]|nr:hypothetical protein [Methylococcaceae bacterium]